MSHETLVRFCAPTFAGIKVSSLFTYKYECIEHLKSEIKSKNNDLNSKGVYFEIIKAKNGVALIYVYRPSKLSTILSTVEVRKFLYKYGYNNFTIEKAILKLKQHLLNQDFPHEIGVFLGYPLSDVIAFIKNKGQNEKYVGYWKAYSNAEYAQKVCANYKKCTKIYCEKFADGYDLTKLVVAC